MQNTESVGMTANDVLIEVLESYMEFISVVEYATNFADMPYKIEERLLKTIKQRKKDWQPILEQAKERRKNGNTKILNKII